MPFGINLLNPFLYPCSLLNFLRIPTPYMLPTHLTYWNITLFGFLKKLSTPTLSRLYLPIQLLSPSRIERTQKILFRAKTSPPQNLVRSCGHRKSQFQRIYQRSNTPLPHILLKPLTKSQHSFRKFRSLRHVLYPWPRISHIPLRCYRG